MAHIQQIPHDIANNHLLICAISMLLTTRLVIVTYLGSCSRRKIDIIAVSACNTCSFSPVYMLGVMINVGIKEVNILVLVRMQLLPLWGLCQLPQLLISALR